MTAATAAQRVQATVSVAGQESVEAPAGLPVLGGGRSNRQLLGNDLENADMGARHAAARPPAPGGIAAGDRRYGPP